MNQFKNTGARKIPRRKWHERTADKDIRYRGPLNYQHFQILGWLCIAATQLVLILGLANKMNMLPARYAGLQEPARVMSWLALPFLLIANLAQIMNGQKSYKSLLIKNFCAAAAIWAGYAFLLHRYIVGTVDVINDGTVASLDVVTKFMLMLTSSGLLKIGSPGVLAFNVFVDLFLCTLLMFFLNYRSAAYMVLADDEEREYGDAETAAQKKADYETQGIGVISMRDDFAVIYGEDVVKNGDLHKPENHADSSVPAVPEADAKISDSAFTLEVCTEEAGSPAGNPENG